MPSWSPEHGRAPIVQLVSPGDTAAAADVASEEKVQVVDAGRGAYVLSGSWADGDSGLPFVIDSKGKAYPLVGQGTATLLGYGEHPPGRRPRLAGSSSSAVG